MTTTRLHERRPAGRHVRRTGAGPVYAGHLPRPLSGVFGSHPYIDEAERFDDTNPTRYLGLQPQGGRSVASPTPTIGGRVLDSLPLDPGRVEPATALAPRSDS
jgi:hypothetical protein